MTCKPHAIVAGQAGGAMVPSPIGFICERIDAMEESLGHGVLMATVHAPPKRGDRGKSTGEVILLVDDHLISEWERAVPGVDVWGQLTLAGEYIAENDMHGYYPKDAGEEAILQQDVQDCTAFALKTTSLGRLGVKPAIEWLGTLIVSLVPPDCRIVIGVKHP